MKKYLIVTADDFGLHVAVNEAVEQAARGGVLTCASLMAGASAAADAVRRARTLPGLRVGLHLVLADGRAILPQPLIPALVDAGGRFGSGMAAAGLGFLARPAVRRQLEAEIRAQFQAFARTGLTLDHVNAHKHFHLHPTLLSLVLRIGREFGMGAVRLPREPLWFSLRGAGVRGAAAAALLAPWLTFMQRRLRKAGIAHNDQVFGIARSGSMTEEALLEILGRLPEGITEIYLHPASISGAAIAPSMRGYRHSDELAALLSPRVQALLAGTGVRRGGYADLPAARAPLAA